MAHVALDIGNPVREPVFEWLLEAVGLQIEQLVLDSGIPGWFEAVLMA